MRYRVQQGVAQGVVDVYLEEDCGEVQIYVGEWCIGVLTRKGMLRLDDGIPRENDEGLKITDAGKIEVE